jgi:hypothetical protein
MCDGKQADMFSKLLSKKLPTPVLDLCVLGKFINGR